MLLTKDILLLGDHFISFHPFFLYLATDGKSNELMTGMGKIIQVYIDHGALYFVYDERMMAYI